MPALSIIPSYSGSASVVTERPARLILSGHGNLPAASIHQDSPREGFHSLSARLCDRERGYVAVGRGDRDVLPSLSLCTVYTPPMQR